MYSVHISFLGENLICYSSPWLAKLFYEACLPTKIVLWAMFGYKIINCKFHFFFTFWLKKLYINWIFWPIKLLIHCLQCKFCVYQLIWIIINCKYRFLSFFYCNLTDASTKFLYKYTLIGYLYPVDHLDFFGYNTSFDAYLTPPIKKSRWSTGRRLQQTWLLL